MLLKMSAKQFLELKQFINLDKATCDGCGIRAKQYAIFGQPYIAIDDKTKEGHWEVHRLCGKCAKPFSDAYKDLPIHQKG